MWSGDPAVWNRTAPIMFPICGGLRDDKFTYEGKAYTLAKHGFVLFREFDCEEHSQDALTLVTHDSPDTREVYPFNFEFRVRFTLDANTLHVSFITTNTVQSPCITHPVPMRLMPARKASKLTTLCSTKPSRLYAPCLTATI